MDRMVSQRAASRSLVIQLICCIVVFAFLATPSLGYKTTSPVVTKMVDKAAKFLQGASHGEPGGAALIGLALYKNKKTMDHPKVAQMAEQVAGAVRGDIEKMDIYSTGLSLIFLCTYDKDKYRSEILKILKSLEDKQKEHGGWGYPAMKTGDTSMTQYGVLGTWEAKKAKFKVSPRVVDRVAKWLLKTQDPSGAWGYQGRVSDSGKLMNQSEIRHSLVAAGLGSVYICADLIGMNRKSGGGDKRNPDIVKANKDDEKKEEDPDKAIEASVSRDLIRAAMARGNGWFDKNMAKEAKVEVFYYLYALERYQTFRELSEGKDYDQKKTEGPKWYNDGVDYLKKTQEANGTWDCDGQCKVVVNTAFGMLFLLRSTKQSTGGKTSGFGEGWLQGGRGLPKDGEFLGSDGRVVKRSPLGPFAALENALKGQNAQDLSNAMEQLERETKGKESTLLASKFQEQFQKLLSNPNPLMRQKAIEGLVETHDMDNVPLLILALGDKDQAVVIAARDGLRRLTLRFQGFGLPDDSTADERRIAMERWKEWYLSVRPNTEF